MWQFCASEPLFVLSESLYVDDRLGDCGFGAGPEALKRPTVARCESRKPSRQSAAVRPGKRRATSPQKAFPYGPWASKSGSSRPSTTLP